MRKISEIKRDLATATQRFKDLQSGQDVKPEDLEEARNNVSALMTELSDARLAEEADRQRAENNIGEHERNELQRFSYAKFIRESAAGNITGFEAEMAEEARREVSELGESLRGAGIPYKILAFNRAAAGQNATTANDGGNLIQEEPIVYVEALRNKLVLVGLGARYLTGLRGSLPIVKGGSFTAGWYGETEDVTGGKASYPKVNLDPKRLSVAGAYSVQLLNQSSPDVERLIVDELLMAHAGGLEGAVINGDGNKEPLGILNNGNVGVVVGGDNGAAPSWKHIVDLETEVSASNADIGNLAYLTNSKVRGKLKQTEKSANTAKFIMENKEVNGYNTVVTNAVPSDISKGTGTNLSAMLYGNWADVIIGHWGGLDLVVDPYSLKKSAQVEIVLHAFHNTAIRNDKSFSVIKDLITD